ncbi:unnamed protein product, partial [Nesidiocoris tenuis]
MRSRHRNRSNSGEQYGEAPASRFHHSSRPTSTSLLETCKTRRTPKVLNRD